MARRRYTRSVSVQPVRTQPAYWETETPTGGPQGIQIGNYVVKHYPSAGKVQTYNYFNGPRYQGLSKGVTINLDLMTAEELEALRSLLSTAIDAEKQRRIAAAPAQPAICEPDPAQPTQPAADPARFKSLLQAVLAKTRTAAAAV